MKLNTIKVGFSITYTPPNVFWRQWFNIVQTRISFWAFNKTYLKKKLAHVLLRMPLFSIIWFFMETILFEFADKAEDTKTSKKKDEKIKNNKTVELLSKSEEEMPKRRRSPRLIPTTNDASSLAVEETKGTGYSFWDRLRNFLHKFSWIVLSVHKLNKLDKYWKIYGQLLNIMSSNMANLKKKIWRSHDY